MQAWRRAQVQRAGHRFAIDAGEGRANQIVLILPRFDQGAITRRRCGAPQHLGTPIGFDVTVDEPVAIGLAEE